jgi:ABC-type antimicrobial peptide transport system permease subunit
MSMDQVVASSLSSYRQLRLFLAVFAALALVLGAIGVYGVVSYAVSRRRAEFGLRMALGATSWRVLREVATGGLRPVMIGVAAGVVFAAYLSRFVTGFLFEVKPLDALSLGGAAAVLLLAGVVAVIVPGLRAGRASPVSVLRGD